MTSLFNLIRSKTNITEKDLLEDEYYYEDFIIFNDCPLCNITINNDESYFTYVLKFPHQTISNCCIYMNIKLRTCYDCLRLGLHKYYIMYKSFPKLRRDGYTFHNLLQHSSKQQIDNQIGYPQYGVPKKYSCNFYNKYNEHILKQLNNIYH